MGFIERLSGVLQNNKNVGFRSNTSKTYLGEGFNYQALNSHNLAKDSFVQNPQIKYVTDVNNRALTRNTAPIAVVFW